MKEAAILSCSDSQVPPEFVFNQSPGDLFAVRILGAVAEPGATGSLEYAVQHLGVRLIVVMGHTSCTGVKAAREIGELVRPRPEDANREVVLRLIRPALLMAQPQGDPWTAAVRVSVEQTKQDLLGRSTVLQDAVQEGSIRIVGALFDANTGEVSFRSTPLLPAEPGLEVGKPNPLAVIE